MIMINTITTLCVTCTIPYYRLLFSKNLVLSPITQNLLQTIKATICGTFIDTSYSSDEIRGRVEV